MECSLEETTRQSWFSPSMCLINEKDVEAVWGGHHREYLSWQLRGNGLEQTKSSSEQEDPGG